MVGFVPVRDDAVVGGALGDADPVVGLDILAWPDCAGGNTHPDDGVRVLAGRTLVGTLARGVLGEESIGTTGQAESLGAIEEGPSPPQGLGQRDSQVLGTIQHASPGVSVSEEILADWADIHALVGGVIGEVGLRALRHASVGLVIREGQVGSAVVDTLPVSLV